MIDFSIIVDIGKYSYIAFPEHIHMTASIFPVTVVDHCSASPKSYYLFSDTEGAMWVPVHGGLHDRLDDPTTAVYRPFPEAGCATRSTTIRLGPIADLPQSCSQYPAD